MLSTTVRTWPSVHGGQHDAPPGSAVSSREGERTGGQLVWPATSAKRSGTGLLDLGVGNKRARPVDRTDTRPRLPGRAVVRVVASDGDDVALRHVATCRGGELQWHLDAAGVNNACDACQGSCFRPCRCRGLDDAVDRLTMVVLEIALAVSRSAAAWALKAEPARRGGIELLLETEHGTLGGDERIAIDVVRRSRAVALVVDLSLVLSAGELGILLL